MLLRAADTRSSFHVAEDETSGRAIQAPEAIQVYVIDMPPGGTLTDRVKASGPLPPTEDGTDFLVMAPTWPAALADIHARGEFAGLIRRTDAGPDATSTGE